MQPQTIAQFLEFEEFKLANGKKLEKIQVAFETYGKLNEQKDNAILVFHALSGSAHLAGYNKDFEKECGFWTEENYRGWWDEFVGNSKLIDTEKHFVICQNILGGCYGTTGPASTNPKTGMPYGSLFPELEAEDIARLQKLVLERLGIEKLKAVIGSSLGGYLALEFAMLFGKQVEKVLIIGSAAKTSNLNTLHNLEQIFAIENDPNYHDGDYYKNETPWKGLMLARMIAVKTYLDIDAITERAREEAVLPNDYFYNYKVANPIESYLFHQGKKFVKRFDANTYLSIVKALQKFNIPKKYGNESLAKAFERLKDWNIEFLIVSIDSDVCFYTEEQEELVKALNSNGIKYRFELVNSKKGHDSFLLEPEKYHFIKEFLESSKNHNG